MIKGKEQDILGCLRKSRRIVVIKQRYVGDTIWTLPFLENLKLNLPEARVAVVSNEGTETFFAHNDYIDEVLPYPERKIRSEGALKGGAEFIRFVAKLRRFRADTAIELTNSDKSTALALLSGAAMRIGYRFEPMPRHRLLTHVIPFPEVMHWVRFNLQLLERLGLRIFSEEIRNFTPQDAFSSLRLQAPGIFEKDSRKKILVHPGARMPLRQWGTQRYARLCDDLSSDFRVLLAAGPDEGSILSQVLAEMETVPEFASSQLSLQEFAALCELSDVFVGNDSGPIHIAATKCPVVGIYGPNCEEFAGPWTPRRYLFEGPELFCRKGCNHRSCAHENHQACLSWVTPELVAAKVRELIAAPQR